MKCHKMRGAVRNTWKCSSGAAVNTRHCLEGGVWNFRIFIDPKIFPVVSSEVLWLSKGFHPKSLQLLQIVPGNGHGWSRWATFRYPETGMLPQNISPFVNCCFQLHHSVLFRNQTGEMKVCPGSRMLPGNVFAAGELQHYLLHSGWLFPRDTQLQLWRKAHWFRRKKKGGNMFRGLSRAFFTHLPVCFHEIPVEDWEPGHRVTGGAQPAQREISKRRLRVCTGNIP